jgi:Ca2+-binding RTX toxin-like protein
MQNREERSGGTMTDIPSNYFTDARFEGLTISSAVVEGTYSGLLETEGDEDWIQVTLFGGVTYTIAAHLADGNVNDNGDSFLWIFDGTGTAVAFDNDNGSSRNSVLTFTPATTRQFFISVSDNSGFTGEYSVEMNTVGGLANKVLGPGADVYTGASGERIFGGKGNDTITMNLPLVAHGDQGDDIITSTVEGILYGGIGNDRLTTGAAAAGHAFGEAGDDVLTAGTGGAVFFGGPGNDTLIGGTNNDELSGNDGSDLLTGTSGNDRLTGGAGTDVLNGGAGMDRMWGGSGDDIYFVDNAGGDAVNEFTGDGNDLIASSITLSLADATRVTGAVERLTLSGAATINGTGNALANTIVGNTAANTLDGGAGNDSLFGMSGNDVLVGSLGNDFHNGGVNNDRLRGGLGNDTQIGGANNDLFVFDTAPNTVANRDVIADFNPAQDSFQMENAVFTLLGAPGALNPNFFFAGAAAHDPNDRIVYNKATGIAIYDSNGNAAGGVTQFAVLTNKPTLTAADFIVI